MPDTTSEREKFQQAITDFRGAGGPQIDAAFARVLALYDAAQARGDALAAGLKVLCAAVRMEATERSTGDDDSTPPSSVVVDNALGEADALLAKEETAQVEPSLYDLVEEMDDEPPNAR